MRRLYHVARADFLQRIRSRRLLVALAVIAYIGFLVNVGQIELAYQIRDGDTVTYFHGEPTAEFIGMKAGLTGTLVLIFGGFYLMNNTLSRDRTHNVSQLVASTPVSDRTYILGKWLSNVALGGVIVVTLGVATIVNHAVHGVGTTDPVALLVPLIVFAIPISALVGGIALLFETIDRLNGSLGNICYLLLMATVVPISLVAAQGLLPNELPIWVKAGDLTGQIAVYEMTANALLDAVPGYSGRPPNIGTLEGDRTFRWEGGNWPVWVFPQRTGLIISSLLIVFVATVPFDRLQSSDPATDSGWLSRFVPSLSVSGWSKTKRLSQYVPSLPGIGRNNAAVEETFEQPDADSISLTPIRDRDAGGFRRLVAAELRLALRGQPWWWYVGAMALVVVPIIGLVNVGTTGGSIEPFRKQLLPIAFIWPLFIWSAMGVRTSQNQVTDLVLSSKYPIGQIVAEWLAGVLIAMGLGSGMVVLFVGTGHLGAVLGYASGVLFAPSLAIAAGIWTRSSTLFELFYLLLWYAGPLNGAVPVDFAGSTSDSIEMGVPIVFIGLSIVLFGAAVGRRKLEIT
ncbi:ABC transporter permease [Halopiger djelfimassiliensis]|uniref:ABC transporter permease n=1 Tax=Halopiger djelfimassiliensis TaxID=1293047 RepID=UPI000AA1FFB0|nr:ABC transporter permease subunit [Halopiger djelfimassiliensis]